MDFGATFIIQAFSKELIRTSTAAENPGVKESLSIVTSVFYAKA
jgi:hypothetical protein